MRLVVHGLVVALIVALLGSFPAVAEENAPRTANCRQCQPFADEYNKATAAVAVAEAERDRLEAEKSAIQERMRVVQDEMSRATGRVARAEDQLRVDRLNERHSSDIKKAEDKVAAEKRQLDEATARRDELTRQMEALEPTLAAAEAALAAEKAAQDAAAARLDACETLCKARGGISTITEDGYVVTWCEACKDLEAALNLTIRERRRIGGQIVIAQDRLKAAMAEEAALQGEQRAAFEASVAATIETNRVREAQPQNAAAIKAADQRSSAAAAHAISFDDRLTALADKRAAAQAEVDRLIDRRDNVLPKQEAEQRAALEKCENEKCGPPAPGPAGRIATPVGPITVTTECPACQQLAADLQETLRAIAARGAEADGINGQIASEREAMAAAAEAEKGVHEDKIAELEEARAAKLAEYNDLVGLAREQRIDLEACEKQCKKEPPKRPLPDLRTSLLQEDDACRRNQDCALVATLANEGESDSGPLFIAIDARVSLPEDGSLNGLMCMAAARGTTLCYGEDVSLDSGASLVLALPVAAEPEICLARETPSAEDRATIAAWLQFGLAARGFPPGAIDGQIGPKTYAAIEALLASDAAPDAVGMTDAELLALIGQRTAGNRDLIEAEVFERLFGEQPAATGEEDRPECIRLRLVRETPKAAPKTPVPDEEEDEDVIRLDNRPTIRLDFGPAEAEQDGNFVEDGGQPGGNELRDLRDLGISF